MALKRVSEAERAIAALDESIRVLQLQRAVLVESLPRQRARKRPRRTFVDPATGKQIPYTGNNKS